MIQLKRFPEPAYFDSKVRQKGLAYFRHNGVDLNIAVPSNIEIKNYWSACKNDLYSLYEEYCAYTCLHIHKLTGSSAVEHILPKRLFPRYAYEWENYCLACSQINSKKGEQTNIINPFKVDDDLFSLILETGFMFATPSHSLFQIADHTITNLDLNNQKWCDARRDCLAGFVENRQHGLDLPTAEKQLKEESIFVWREAKNQGYLK